MVREYVFWFLCKDVRFAADIAIILILGIGMNYTYYETPQQVFDRILKYKHYFGDHGGVTVSGGEALLQPVFVRELFSLCKNSRFIHCLDHQWPIS